MLSPAFVIEAVGETSNARERSHHAGKQVSWERSRIGVNLWCRFVAPTYAYHPEMSAIESSESAMVKEEGVSSTLPSDGMMRGQAPKGKLGSPPLDHGRYKRLLLGANALHTCLLSFISGFHSQIRTSRLDCTNPTFRMRFLRHARLLEAPNQGAEMCIDLAFLMSSHICREVEVVASNRLLLPDKVDTSSSEETRARCVVAPCPTDGPTHRTP